MELTLDQIRALDALDRAGTFMRAAQELRKGHSSVLYLVRTAEDAVGFPLLDRTGYRTRFTPRGKRLLESARAVLAAEAALVATTSELRAGWEPQLQVVFDGIVPIDPLLHAVGKLVAEKIPTKIDVRAEFLSGVEAAFEQSAADMMIAVLPPRTANLTSVALAPFTASLVAHRQHPLATGKHDERALREHLLLTVRGSDPRLDLPTAGLEAHSSILLNDFSAKRAAILAGIGYGWLPDTMIASELERRRLRRIRWTGASTHPFRPRVYHRGQLGPAGRRVVEALSH